MKSSTKIYSIELFLLGRYVSYDFFYILVLLYFYGKGVNMLKQIKWRSILVGIGYIIAGLLLIVYPESSRNLIAYVLGIALVVYGIVSLTTYFVINVKDSLRRNEFSIGIMAITAGLIIIFKQQILLDIIPVLLGLLIIADGIGKLQNAVVAKRIGSSQYFTYIVLSAVSIVLGFVVMFFLTGVQLQKTLFVVIGISLVYCGISAIFVILFIADKFHKFLKSFEINGRVIEAEVEEKPVEETVKSNTEEEKSE